MKSNLLKLLAVSCLAIGQLTPFAAFAGDGPGGGNGGDPQEIEFKEIAQNISGWIHSGNADDLTFPASITLGMYKSKMLTALGYFHISFTSSAIMVAGVEKTCRNQISQERLNVVCNTTRFAAESSDDKYRLVHHEIAGLAGLETNTGTDSNYAISDQVSARLENEVVRRLPIQLVVRSNNNADAIAAYFQGTGVKDVDGPCESIDLKAVNLDRYAKLAEGFKKILMANGREVVEVRSKIKKAYNDTFVGTEGTTQTLYHNILYAIDLSFVLKGGVVLDAVLHSNRIFPVYGSKDNEARLENFSGFGTEYYSVVTNTYGKNGERLSTDVKCKYNPTLDGFMLRNHDTHQAVMGGDGSGVRFTQSN